MVPYTSNHQKGQFDTVVRGLIQTDGLDVWYLGLEADEYGKT
jgi:hypothetical protein